MADHYLTKTQINLAQCIRLGDGLALEGYPALQALLAARVSPVAAALFAEPLLSRGNDVTPATVSWYSVHAGEGRSLRQTDEQTQARVSAVISKELRLIRDLLSDPDDGALVGAALHLANIGDDDIWVVGDQPVIINWGMLPDGVGNDPEGRRKHYAASLGRLLPLSSAPPLNAEERKSRADIVGSAALGAGAAAAVAAPSGVLTGEAVSTSAAATANPAPAAPANAAARGIDDKPGRREARRGMPVIAWLPLLILLILASGVLIWLLLPTTRLFPANQTQRFDVEAGAVSTAAELNEALRSRIASLRGAITDSICLADGTLILPEGRTIDGLLPPTVEEKSQAMPSPQPGVSTPAIVPSPDRVQLPADPNVPPGLAESNSGSLLDVIERRTVMVLAESEDVSGSGTGFFVAPDLVVTNHHVIDGGQYIFVTNDALGALHPAQVIASFGPFEAVGGDFALLRVENSNSPYFSLLNSPSSLKLQGVIAAGYPGDVLETDSSYARLREGDLTAVPDLMVTDGTVNTVQQLGPGSSAVVHSAPISRGNSGGPLIDLCGRVIGVNTFVRQGDVRNLNFALAIPDLLTFLGDANVPVSVETNSCNPMVNRPTAGAVAEAEPADVEEALPPEAEAAPVAETEN